MILEPATVSGEKSASAVIYAAPAALIGIDLLPPSSGIATLKIYDHPSAASGTIVAELVVAAGMNAQSVHLAVSRRALTGLYASLTGTTTYIVAFHPMF